MCVTSSERLYLPATNPCLLFLRLTSPNSCGCLDAFESPILVLCVFPSLILVFFRSGGNSDESQVENQFVTVFGQAFIRVPNSKQYFFYSPGTDQPVDEHIETTLNLRKRRRPVGEMTSPRDSIDEDENENEDLWNTDADLAPLVTSAQANATHGVFSHPFFVRMECLLLPKSPDAPQESSSSAIAAVSVCFRLFKLQYPPH